VTCNSPDAFREACRLAARDGVDTFKINVSGDRGFEPWGAGTESTVMTDEEMAAIVQVAKARGKRVAAHAASAGSVKMCLRHGVALMGDPDGLGQIRPGYLADLLLVDGDPLADIAILQDAGKLSAIMKGGAFHKRPPSATAQRRAAE